MKETDATKKKENDKVKDSTFEQEMNLESIQELEPKNPLKEEKEPSQAKRFPPVEIFISALLIFVLTHRTPYSGIGACIGEGVFLATIYKWSKKHSRPLSTEAWIAGSFAFVYALMDVITSSSLSHTINQYSFWMANIMFIGLGFGAPFIQRHPFRLVQELIQTLVQGLSYAPLKSFIQMPPPEEIRPYTKGLTIAVPILCIFFGLFSQADARFASQSLSMLQSITGENAKDILYGLFVFLATLSFMLILTENLFGKSLSFSKVKEQEPTIQKESNIVLTLVNILFATFLFSQLPYLFGGESYRYAQNLNYSDYAVSGFYELMIVVGLVIFMSITLRSFHQEKMSMIQKFLYGLLLGQSLIILVSAFSRMNLYIDVYGYTQARIFGCIFMLASGIGLLFSMHNIFIEEKQHILIKKLILTVACSGLLYGFMQPDLNSARWNIEKTEPTAQEFLRNHDDHDVGTILALLEMDPTAKSTFRYSNFCTTDPRSFQINRFALCQKLK